ncbi:MAG: hypothetical protein ABIG85_00155, partial [Chloroflexota bacterium]
MQESTPSTGAPATADLIPDVEAAPAAAPIAVSTAAPPLRGSRVRTIGLATLAGAIGIGAIAIAVVAGGPRNDAAPAAVADQLQAAAPLGEVSAW